VDGDEYRFSEESGELDFDRVHQWLSVESYWATGRPREVVVRSFGGSFPVGVYDADGQVAVARIVSDGATFAWLCDVFVDKAHRGHGLGTRLASWAADWAEQRGVHRVILATRDAHGVYEKAGFEPVERPDIWMEIDNRPVRRRNRPEPTE
jgi:GNAT superfamily N-acetyltransferase